MRMTLYYGVLGNAEPMAVEVAAEGCGNVGFVRRSIEQDCLDDGDRPIEFWKWDELRIDGCELDAGSLEEAADALWYEAERAGMTDDERRADTESALLDVQEAIAELYEMILEG